MPKKDENGGSPQNENQPRNSTPAFRAVEEHAAALGISAPVFVAVKAAKGWNAGKKVEQTEFEKAVKEFLNAHP